MKKKWIPFLVILIFLAACSGAAPEEQVVADEAAPTEEQAPETSEIDPLAYPADLPPLPEANPLNLEISLEQDNTVTDLIRHDEEGSLSVTASDGTLYTLSIPAAALLSPAEISMTPLDQVGNLPIDEAIANGVLLEPDGLVFIKPATLTIQFPPSTELEVALGFGTFTAGEDFHFKPSKLQEQIVTLEVNHFSAVGVITVGGGRDGSSEGDSDIGIQLLREANSRYSPFRGETRFSNQLAMGFGPSSSDAEFADLYETALKQWFHSSVKVGLHQAGGESNIIDPALANAKRWADWVGTPPEPLTREEFRSRFNAEYDQMWDLMARAFKNAFDEAERKCQNNDDGPDEAATMIKYYTMIDALIPKSATGTPRLGFLYGNQGLEVSKVEEQINDCFSFRLDFRSKVEIDFGGQGTFVAQYQLKDIELEFDFDKYEITVEEDYTNEYVKFQSAINCPASSQPGRVKIDIFAYANLSYTLPEITNLWLDLLFLEKPRESFNCGIPVEGPFWHSNFASAYHLKNTPQELTSVPLRIVRTADAYAQYSKEFVTELKGQLTTGIDLIHYPIE